MSVRSNTTWWRLKQLCEDYEVAASPSDVLFVMRVRRASSDHTAQQILGAFADQNNTCLGTSACWS